MTPFWRRRHREAELDEEIAGHLAMAAREREARGEPPEQAAYAARREFGNATHVKELTRDAWTWPWLDAWRRELRYALRSLRRSPGFVAIAVVSLAFGLGLATTMFSLLDAVRHPAMPYRDPARLWTIGWRYDLHLPIKSFDVLRAVRDETRSFRGVLPVTTDRRTLQVGGETEQVRVAKLPARALAVLGVRPELGRALTDADADQNVAVVSHDVWRQYFAGRRFVQGATIALDGQIYAVAGVMPRGMAFGYGSDVWLAMSAASERSGAGLGSVFGVIRLEPRITPAVADTELAVLARSLTVRYHAQSGPFSIGGGPMRVYPDQLSGVDVAMLGASLAVLLIVCVNLANLMLARGLAKRRELALRLAIGASRAAVVRQMFAECAVITAAGAVLGAAASIWGAEILPTRVARSTWWLGIVEPQLSWRVFALALLAAVASAVVFGLLPAIRVARSVSLDEPLKDGAGTTGRVRHRYSALVISEVGLSLVLLMQAGLLVRSVHKLAVFEFNFPTRHLLSGWAQARLADARTPADRLRFQQSVLGAARGVTGVLDAATVGDAPAPGAAITAELSGDSNRVLTMMYYPVVSPGYLRTMGLPIVNGRDFTDGDLAGNGAVILNTTAAAHLYPHESAVGHMIKLGGANSGAAWVPVVGVSRAAVSRSLDDPSTAWLNPEIYVVRAADADRRLTVMVRTAGDDRGIALALTRAVKTLNPQFFGGFGSYLSDYETTLLAHRMLADLFVTMAAFALALAAVGVYGVLAYAVSRRLREFAVRIALGAQREDMLRLVLHDGLVMALAGTGIGAFAAMAAAGTVSMALAGVYPTDAITLVAVEAILVAVSMAACLAPAFRAMRADPIAILRAT